MIGKGDDLGMSVSTSRDDHSFHWYWSYFLYNWYYDTIQWSNFWYYVQSKKHPRHVKAIYLENVRCTVEKQHLCKSPSHCWADRRITGSEQGGDVFGKQRLERVATTTYSALAFCRGCRQPAVFFWSFMKNRWVTRSEQDSICSLLRVRFFRICLCHEYLENQTVLNGLMDAFSCSLDDFPFDFRSMSNMCKRSHMMPERAADWLRAAWCSFARILLHELARRCDQDVQPSPTYMIVWYLSWSLV